MAMEKGKKSMGLVLVVACFNGLLSCGTARRGEPFQNKPKFAENSKAAMGQAVFSKNCQPCHPGGEAGMGPAINNKPAPGFVIRRQVRIGLGAMPGFKETEISETEMDQLLAFIKAMRKKKPSNSVTGKKA